MVWRLEFRAHHAKKGLDQPFGLPKRLLENQSQRERRLNRQVGVVALAPSFAAMLRMPVLRRVV